MNALVICSGGLDSVSLAHKVATEQKLIGLLSFDYGQRHKKELGFASICAKRLGVPHQIVDIRDVGRNLGGSALTDSVDVPDGHYAEDSMRITVVPNRNAIMLAIAFGVAAAQKADAVATAVHGGDHFIYPDCRPAFIDAFQTMQNHALAGYADIRLYAPYVNMTKADIVSEGAKYATPFEATWSCYKGGARHCGRCGTCVERREAFDLAGIADPTDYEDADFWLHALQTRSA
ncbi:7-cyano-7-deazaguanine synthase QueC [Mesorhizobium sp. M0208]|uniref:7-cyano-7-deazaguanine synthase QueC n=1 Tax=Mesorhizobium sp. M0208 TaxID=2956916 RepID=UPI00333A616E